MMNRGLLFARKASQQQSVTLITTQSHPEHIPSKAWDVFKRLFGSKADTRHRGRRKTTQSKQDTFPNLKQNFVSSEFLIFIPG